MYNSQLGWLGLSSPGTQRNTGILDLLSVPDFAAGVLSNAYKHFAKGENEEKEDRGNNRILAMLAHPGQQFSTANVRLSYSSDHWFDPILLSLIPDA